MFADTVRLLPEPHGRADEAEAVDGSAGGRDRSALGVRFGRLAVSAFALIVPPR